MRRLIPALTLGITLVIPRPVLSAEAVTCNAVQDDIGDSHGTCASGGSARVAGAAGPRRPLDLITALSSTPAVGSCTILATTTSRQGQQELRFQHALANVNDAFSFVLPDGVLNRLWAWILASEPGCPGTAPLQVAFAFVREVIPPGPDPWIAPGYAITGKPAFLETRGPTSTPRRYDTPLGPLDVSLRATGFGVDWGDDTWQSQGPFVAPGRPWPDGTALHTYTDVGRYEVVVTQGWDADWRLAGQAGTVNGLSSTGRIDAFEALQMQAVINR